MMHCHAHKAEQAVLVLPSTGQRCETYLASAGRKSVKKWGFTPLVTFSRSVLTIKWLVLICLVFCLYLPSNAYAELALLGTDCNTGTPSFGDTNSLVKPVVDCVDKTIRGSVDALVNALSDYLKPTVTVVFALATATFGIQILAGEQGLYTKSMSFLMRIGLVYIFSYNLDNFADDIYAIMDELDDIVSPNGTPCMGSGRHISGQSCWFCSWPGIKPGGAWTHRVSVNFGNGRRQLGSGRRYGVAGSTGIHA